jgi:NitT/TauT family transport system permease protein
MHLSGKNLSKGGPVKSIKFNRRDSALTALAHVAFVAVALGIWEAAVLSGWVNRTFFGQPSGIVAFLWNNFVRSFTLWSELGWTLFSTGIAFVSGSIAAILLGLLFASAPKLEKFLEPYLSAFNAMPRIALMPLFLLWFGLGVGSKIALGFSLTFFIVLSSTIAGMRGASSDLVTLTRTLGSTEKQMFMKVTLPSAVPVIFSGLRLGLIYSLLGVVGGELIAAQNGLGQVLAYLGSTFNMDGVMALLFVLAIVGSGVTWGMTILEKRLLNWQ